MKQTLAGTLCEVGFGQNLRCRRKEVSLPTVWSQRATWGDDHQVRLREWQAQQANDGESQMSLDCRIPGPDASPEIMYSEGEVGSTGWRSTSTGGIWQNMEWDDNESFKNEDLSQCFTVTLARLLYQKILRAGDAALQLILRSWIQSQYWRKKKKKKRKTGNRWPPLEGPEWDVFLARNGLGTRPRSGGNGLGAF